ncbi:MAG: nucleotidyltransferase family protein [Spirochaetales bacterium]|nr:nucleotidyltransferase family protein [Spirochaetales bacterium]
MVYGWGRLNREEDLILALLREDYSKAEKILTQNKSFSFPYFLRLAVLHRIHPLLLTRLIDRFAPLLTKDLIRGARLHILQQQTANKLHRKELLSAGALLTEAGFDVTLMKGLSYDPNEKIPRTYGDVDLLIEESRIGEVLSLLEEKGYTYQGSFILSRKEKRDISSQFSWNNQYPFLCPHSTQSIEIHTNLFERDRIRLENLTVLLDQPHLFRKNRRWRQDLNCYLPGREASLMLLCLHVSLKRALYNNRFILRHMSDMKLLMDGGIDGNMFVELCREGQVCFHARFALRLYEIIMELPLPPWAEELERDLKRGERFLLKRHLKCLKNLRHSRRAGRMLYNFTAPFIIGKKGRPRLTWLRNNFLPTKVEQENRYYRFGFKEESPLIYLTYLINPFQTAWRSIKRLLKIKDSSSPES